VRTRATVRRNTGRGTSSRTSTLGAGKVASDVGGAVRLAGDGLRGELLEFRITRSRREFLLNFHERGI
jgi:hypothetical protein